MKSALVTPSFGLWGRFPNDQPIRQDNWPKEIVKALNSQRRVYGAGGYDSGWTFYFVGNTADLNAFLRQVAKQKGCPIILYLVPEPGTNKPDVQDPNLKIEFTWSFTLRAYRDFFGMFDREPNETDEQFQKRRMTMPEYDAQIVAHCVGPIDPGSLKIPLEMDAEVGGRLAGLADLHKQRQREFVKDGKVPADATPTSEADYPTNTLFSGGATTQPAETQPDQMKSSRPATGAGSGG